MRSNQPANPGFLPPVWLMLDCSSSGYFPSVDPTPFEKKKKRKKWFSCSHFFLRKMPRRCFVISLPEWRDDWRETWMG
jgi:hypothetical protein